MMFESFGLAAEEGPTFGKFSQIVVWKVIIAQDSQNAVRQFTVHNERSGSSFGHDGA